MTGPKTGGRSRAADAERRNWPESNLSKLLTRLKLHHAELFPLPRDLKISHSKLCSSHVRYGTCDCSPTLTTRGQTFVGG